MNDNLDSLSRRFAQERKRLGLSQADIADAIGKTREMIGRYERGLAIPGGDVLMSLATIGMDVYYILLGRREDEPSREMLQPDEKALIHTYRSLGDDDDKSYLIATADAIAERAKKYGTNKSVRKKPKDKGNA